MKYLTNLILFLFALNANAQERVLHGHKRNATDTTFYFKYIRDLSDSLHISRIPTTPHKFHFRFWGNYYAIDIKDYGITYVGELVNYYAVPKYFGTNRQNYSKVTSYTDAHNYYYEKKVLDSSTVATIMRLVDSLKIADIPNSDSIPNWPWGVDGISCKIEYATQTEYHLKNYWGARLALERGINYAKQITLLEEHMYDVAYNNKSYTTTFSNIPKDCYNIDQTTLCLYRKHKAQYRQKKRAGRKAARIKKRSSK